MNAPRKSHMRTILFAGGGTLGPVTPLLAVAARMREARPDVRFAWAGTDQGPERTLVEEAGIPFATVATAKLPRYLTPRLFTVPFDYLRARRDAERLLNESHPALVISAGGYTAVPVIREAVRRRIPCIAHQLDYAMGLSNRMIAKYCRYVTTSFSYHEDPFGGRVINYHIPTPTRFGLEDIPSRESACRYFGFDPDKQIVLVIGGGTGARTLNQSFYALRNRLPEGTQVLHVTGLGKSEGLVSETPAYVISEFLTDAMPSALAAADVVVSRAGVGAIAELAALKKAAILVPLPDSPQGANVRALGDAVRVVAQTTEDSPTRLLAEVLELLGDVQERARLGVALHDVFPTDRGDALAGLALTLLV